ncbi:ATP-binding cassette domain-containing protein [uncultured Endozoicomonas sp.]|uniref:peptidase domain-containing ABC transporter n=1 Tax=uncultured Endozoicomonas sp. TaxID=432652 RepID=UPI00260CEF04|nr:ATP-binding cassette domain-containing protein [uncultured Endozoicomonas sp.]
MQKNTQTEPTPGNLELAVMVLFRLQGVDLPHDYARTAADQPLDVKHLSDLAKNRGWQHKRYTLPFGVMNDRHFPCLIQLKGKLFHVVMERKGEEFLVMTPEGEQRWIHEEKLQADYSGVIHQLERDPIERNKPKFKQWLRNQAVRLWPQYSQVLLATLMINLLTLGLPIFTHFVFDKVLPGQAMDTLLSVSIGMVIVLILDFLLRWLRSYFLDDACRAIAQQSEASLLKEILHQESHELTAPPAKIAQVIQDFARVKESISSSVLLAVLDIPFFFLFCVAISIIGGPLVWVPLIIAILLIPMSLFSFRLSQEKSAISSQSNQDKNVFLHETIRGIDTIRSMDSRSQVLARWRVLITAATSREFNSKSAGALLTSLVASSTQAVVFGMLVTGVLLIHEGSLPPGSLFACIILGSRAIAPMANLSMALNRISHARQSLQQIRALFSHRLDEEMVDEEHAKELHPVKSLRSGLKIENLSFQYPGTQTLALSNLNFQIKPGERIALLGASGCGKSTLIDLLQANLLPSAGDIKISKHSLMHVDLKDYRKHLGVARQQPTVFAGTVRSNLLMGKVSASKKQIEKVCDLVGLSAFIETCPLGFDHPVSERGLNLSAGQQQALSLARALLHDGELIILDEPTSSFDNVNESLLCKKFPKFLKKKHIFLLITHRASLLQLVDRIILMDGGRIIADGPRDEILARMSGQKSSG